ncbi:MAG: hypothetical protein WBP82_10860 [Leuconostoc mesenteroides]
MNETYKIYLIERARKGDSNAIGQLTRAKISYFAENEKSPPETFDEYVSKRYPVSKSQSEKYKKIVGEKQNG